MFIFGFSWQNSICCSILGCVLWSTGFYLGTKYITVMNNMALVILCGLSFCHSGEKSGSQHCSQSLEMSVLQYQKLPHSKVHLESMTPGCDEGKTAMKKTWVLPSSLPVCMNKCQYLYTQVLQIKGSLSYMRVSHTYKLKLYKSMKRFCTKISPVL